MASAEFAREKRAFKPPSSKMEEWLATVAERFARQRQA
jgi:hypothetical protein